MLYYNSDIIYKLCTTLCMHEGNITCKSTVESFISEDLLLEF